MRRLYPLVLIIMIAPLAVLAQREVSPKSV